MVLKFSTSSPVNSLPVYGTILRAIFSTRKNRILICFKIYLLSKLVFKYDKLNNYAKKNRFKGTLSIHAVWDKSPPLIIFSRTTNCTRPTGLCNLVTLFKNLLFLIYTKLRSKSCGELHQGDFPSKRSCTRSEIWWKVKIKVWKPGGVQNNWWTLYVPYSSQKIRYTFTQTRNNSTSFTTCCYWNYISSARQNYIFVMYI